MNKKMDNLPNLKISYSSLIVILVLLVVMLCGGCMSQQERDGVSLLPHNRPSSSSGFSRSNSGMGFTL